MHCICNTNFLYNNKEFVPFPSSSSKNMFVPGSTAKLFITSAAMDAYGPDYIFQTPVYAEGDINKDRKRKRQPLTKGVEAASLLVLVGPEADCSGQGEKKSLRLECGVMDLLVDAKEG